MSEKSLSTGRDWSILADHEIVELMADIKVWKKGGKRAPHKPLLLLVMLARIQNGLSGRIRFNDLYDPLKQVLVGFGPPRKSYHPEYPFWHLQNDGFWLIDRHSELEKGLQGARRKNNPPKKILVELNPAAGFPTGLENRLQKDPQLVNRIAHRLLEDHFPRSLHEDILDAVGMPWVALSVRRKRDPAFRQTILRIYEHRCAVCGWDGRLGIRDLALEAAHVLWHTVGGPDTEDNGLALCSLHHKAFDLGALGLDEDLRIQVSQEVHGSQRVGEWLTSFSGRPLHMPQRGCSPPARRFIRWHRREVFRGPARQNV